MDMGNPLDCLEVLTCSVGYGHQQPLFLWIWPLSSLLFWPSVPMSFLEFLTLALALGFSLFFLFGPLNLLPLHEYELEF